MWRRTGALLFAASSWRFCIAPLEQVVPGATGCQTIEPLSQRPKVVGPLQTMEPLSEQVLVLLPGDEDEEPL